MGDQWQEPPNEVDAEAVVETIRNVIYGFDDHTTDPGRPFDGQPHTDQGERGKHPTDGLRFRDVADCFLLGWLYASERGSLAESGTATYNDIYEGDYDVDPLAVMQNMLCEMEKRLGIYPNVPKLKADRQEGDE